MVAVVKQARTTKHPWLVACDATTDAEDFQRSLWFMEKCMFMKPREARVTSCRVTGSNGEFLERTYYHESVSKSLQGNIEAIDMRLLFRWTQTWKTREVHELKMPHSFCSGIGGGIIVACCAFLILLCFLLYFVFLWYVVVFVLWYVCVFLLYFVFFCCMYVVVLRVVARFDNLFVESGDSSEEEGLLCVCVACCTRLCFCGNCVFF